MNEEALEDIERETESFPSDDDDIDQTDAELDILIDSSALGVSDTSSESSISADIEQLYTWDGEVVTTIIPEAEDDNDEFSEDSDDESAQELEIDEDVEEFSDPDDYENDNVATVPTIGAITSGERVLVLVKNGVPTVIGSEGWGDGIEADIADAAQVAAEAQTVAEATNQHFFSDSSGVHVTEAEGDATTDHNILINSLGILLRKATNYLVSITSSAIAFYDGLGTAAGNVVASFGASLARIGYEALAHIDITNSRVNFTLPYYYSEEQSGTVEASIYSEYSIEEDAAGPFDLEEALVIEHEDTALKLKDDGLAVLDGSLLAMAGYTSPYDFSLMSIGDFVVYGRALGFWEVLRVDASASTLTMNGDIVVASDVEGTTDGTIVAGGVTVRASNIDRDGTPPSTSQFSNGRFRIADVDGDAIAYSDGYQLTTGETGARLVALAEDANGDVIFNTFRVGKKPDGTNVYYVTDPAAFRSAINAVGSSNQAAQNAALINLSSATQHWALRSNVINSNNTTYHGHNTGLGMTDTYAFFYDFTGQSSIWTAYTTKAPQPADAWDVYKSTTVSQVITAGSGRTVSSVTYAEWGKVVMLSVTCSGFSASTGTQTVGTVVSGKRPVYNVYATGVNSSYATYAQLTSAGALTVYWGTAPSPSTSYVIRFIYILA